LPSVCHPHGKPPIYTIQWRRSTFLIYPCSLPPIETAAEVKVVVIAAAAAAVVVVVVIAGVVVL